MVRNSEAQKIMTPHWGEAARLLQPLDLNDIKRGRAAEILTEKFRSVIVLKGEGTLVAITQQDISINNTGNPGMATAGSGDCLTGIITSFAGQGMGVPAAARAGVYIHGLAGDIAAEELGEYGMTAGDIAGHAKDIVDKMKKRVVAIDAGHIVRDELGQYGYDADTSETEDEEVFDE